MKSRYLIVFTTCLLCVSAVIHNLQFIYTAIPAGIHFPEFMAIGLVDGEQFMIYKSTDSGSLEPAEWMKEFESENYWKSLREDMRTNQDNFNSMFTAINHDKGNHTLQRMYGCEIHNDGNREELTGYDLYGYDGEDFLHFELNGTWTAANNQAEKILQRWRTNGYKGYWKTFLKVDCIEQLRKIVSYIRQTLGRKVVPKVLVFHRHSSPSPEVVCHATGFFPKPLNITWQKDGEDVHEDVELRETLPNQDGSFQKRSILKVPAEELQKHNYTCVVQHSSLEKELVREVEKGGRSDRGSAGRSDGEGSDKGSGGGSGGSPNSIIAAAVVSLVILAAVVAVIVVRKKKNSGGRRKEPDVKFSQNGSRTISSLSFMPVPQKNPDTSEGDSSFNNSNTVTA
ncbi:H-2 class I histocompatibility antigen, Q10 alpha chain-like [Clarias gariepinus]